MKINRHIFHVPPYISTSWKTIAALHVENKPAPTLIISLINGSKIELPPLDEKLLQAIFTIHAQVLEQEHNPPKIPSPAATEPPKATVPAGAENTASLNLALPPALANMENMGAFLQHNLEQAEAPDLPKEMLEKIASLSKVIGLYDNASIPKAEPHCNCYYCQIARAMHGNLVEQENEKENTQEIQEEEVSEEDLKFRLWDIQQTADQLYLVSNPTDTQEHYSVFLGNPIGCTCGNKNCEHIRAVLRS